MQHLGTHRRAVSTPSRIDQVLGDQPEHVGPPVRVGHPVVQVDDASSQYGGRVVLGDGKLGAGQTEQRARGQRMHRQLHAGLTAALTLSFAASIATGAIGAAGLLGTDVPAGGSLAFGAALACTGLVFSAVAAVTAQLSPSARFARGAAFAVLGTAFTVRAVGDAGPGGLSWLSPLGWSLLVKPYAGDRWWVLVLHLVTTAGLTVQA